MNILLLGASGPTGQQVLQQALEHGDTVTALARHPETLEQFGQQVKVVRGDATSAEDLTKAMDGQDVIISALGRGKALRAENLFTDAILAILQAASATGVHRLCGYRLSVLRTPTIRPPSARKRCIRQYCTIFMRIRLRQKSCSAPATWTTPSCTLPL